MLDSGGSREIRSIQKSILMESLNTLPAPRASSRLVPFLIQFGERIISYGQIAMIHSVTSQLSSLGPIFWIIYRIKFGKNVLNENWSSSSSSQHLVYFHSKIMGFERESQRITSLLSFSINLSHLITNTTIKTESIKIS